MGVGGSLEEGGAQLGEEHVGRAREVLRHLLLDGAALLRPILLPVEHVAHAQRLDVQRHVEVLGRHRE